MLNKKHFFYFFSVCCILIIISGCSIGFSGSEPGGPDSGDEIDTSLEPKSPDSGDDQGPDSGEDGDNQGPDSGDEIDTSLEPKSPDSGDDGDNQGPDSGEDGDNQGPDSGDDGDNQGPDSGEDGDNQGPDSGDEIDTSEPTSPDSGDEIDPNEPTSPDSGDEITLSEDFKQRAKGSCNAIGTGSTCVEYIGSYWAEGSNASMNCAGGGAFSKNPCPRPAVGGCNVSAGATNEIVTWHYNYGGDPYNPEIVPYAMRACNALPVSHWIN